MTSDTRFDRRLPAILADLGAGPSPDYTDTLLARTAATRQRPGWAFAERWFPMSALTERVATVPRFPLRAAIAVALVILALLAAALYAGSRPRPLPAPFGPAANGVVVYAAGGDIFAGDPVSGQSRLLVGGPETDGAPGFSPDGTRLAFLREAGSESTLMTATDVGSDVRALATYQADRLVWANWAPDSRHLAVLHTVDDGSNRLDLIDATGSGSVRTIASAVGMTYFQFRPPDGREILYRAFADGRDGLYVMNDDGTNVRQLVDRPGEWLWAGTAAYTPDGSRIFFTRDYEVATATGTCCDLWVMNADGSDQHQFVPNDGTWWNGIPVVSPDGSKIAFWGTGNEEHIATMSTDGTGSPTQVGPRLPSGAQWFAWAPDSSTILLFPNGPSTRAYLADPGGGDSSTLPWESAGELDWQRLAAP